MKETEFIQQNNEKWTELERLNSTKSKDPVKMSDLFIEVTNDLSYSRTHYANRSIKVYLNNLALGIHSRVYRNRLGTGAKFKAFWSTDLPKVMYESRGAVLVAFLVFAAAMAVGVFSSINDPGFARQILGDSYIDMTEEYIQSGDPMKVYKTSREMDMFVGIAINNIRVSFLVFVLGAFFSVGTIGVLIYNGVMVGAFQYFFIARGLFKESFLTIWLHGMPEIMAIVLAGAAGITLGSGLIFPGTYGRKESFLITARRGLIMMIGLVPVFLVAAFIEGFATRYTEIPDAVRGTVILMTGSFMIFYYVIFPWASFNARGETVAQWLRRRGARISGHLVIFTAIIALLVREPAVLSSGMSAFSLVFYLLLLMLAGSLFSDVLRGKREAALRPEIPKATSRQTMPNRAAHDYALHSDKRNGTIYSDVFALFGRTAFYFLPRFLGVSAVYIAGLLLVSGPDIVSKFDSLPGGSDLFASAIIYTFVKVSQVLDYEHFELLYPFNSIVFIVIVTLSLRSIQRLLCDTSGSPLPSLKSSLIRTLPSTILCVVLMQAAFFLPSPVGFFIVLFAAPVVLQLLVNPLVKDDSADGVGTVIAQAFGFYGRHLGLVLMLFVTSVLYLLLFNSGLVDLIFGVLLDGFRMEETTYDLVMTLLNVGLTLFGLAMVIPLFIYGATFGRLATHEIRYAKNLQEQISGIGLEKKAFGALRE